MDQKFPWRLVPLMQFRVRASVVSYVIFVLSLFVPHLSFLVPREGCASCCISSWISSLIF